MIRCCLLRRQVLVGDARRVARRPGEATRPGRDADQGAAAAPREGARRHGLFLARLQVPREEVRVFEHCVVVDES